MTASAIRSENSLDSLVGAAVDDFLRRQRDGENPNVEEYAARHPEAADLLRNVLAALQLLEQSSEGQASLAEHADHESGAFHEPLGDFRLLREVGRGGMGIVYEAEQMSLGRRVALKVLPFASTLDSRQLQRFKNEAQAAACLHHTNIVPVFSTGCERGVHFYAMQFIEGHTLADVIQALKPKEEARHGFDDLSQTKTYASSSSSAPLHELRGSNSTALAELSTLRSTKPAQFYRTAAELGIQAAEALDHAHQMGIVHRDIKPANLLLENSALNTQNSELRVWITDFGLAQIQSENTRLTLTGDLLGTLRYMSPEQALAKRVIVDHRTDIYSLGVTLYELLTLVPAVGGKDRQEILARIASEEPTALRRINKGIPAEVETIVLKMIEKDASSRYDTAKEAADDLRRFLLHEPVKARRPSAWQRLRKWGRRHAAILRAVVAVGFTLTVLGAGLLWREQKRTAEALQLADRHRAAADSRATLLRGKLYASQMTLGHRHWERGDLAELRTLLDQFRHNDELKGFEWQWLAAQAQSAPRELRTYCGHMGTVYCATFSPDDNAVASCSEDRSIHIWDASTGACRAILRARGETATLPVQGHREDENCVSFSPDGRLLASACEDGSVRLWELSTGALRWSQRGHKGEVHQVQFSRDGTFLSTGIDGAVRVWDPASSRQLHEFLGHEAPVNCATFSPDGQGIASADNQGVVNLWRLRGPSLGITIRSGGNVLTLAFSPDGSLLATGERAGAIRLWRVADGKLVASWGNSHAGGVRNLRFAADGACLASCGDDCCVRFCSIPEGNVLSHFRAHAARLWSVCISSDGRRLLTASSDRTARIWTVPNLRRSHGWRATQGLPVLRLTFAPDGKHLAMTTAAGQLLYGDGNQRDHLTTIARDVNAEATPCFSRNGEEVAFVGLSGAVRRIRLAEQRELQPLPTPSPSADEPPWRVLTIRIAYLGDRRLAALLWDGTLLLQDGANWREQHLPAQSIGLPPILTLLPGDKTILTADQAGRQLVIWDLEEGQVKCQKTGSPVGGAYHLSPDCTTLAIGQEYGNIRLIELASGRELPELIGHRLAVTTVAFAPDGKTLASGSRDGTVCLWNVATQQELFVFEDRHGRAIHALAFSPDGRMLAIAGDMQEDGIAVTLYETGVSQ